MGSAKKARLAARGNVSNKYEQKYQETFRAVENGKCWIVPFYKGEEFMVSLSFKIKDLGDPIGAETLINQLDSWVNQLERASVCMIGLPNSPNGNAVGLAHIQQGKLHFMGITFFKNYMEMAKASMEGSRIEVCEGTTPRTIYTKIA